MGGLESSQENPDDELRSWKNALNRANNQIDALAQKVAKLEAELKKKDELIMELELNRDCAGPHGDCDTCHIPKKECAWYNKYKKDAPGPAPKKPDDKCQKEAHGICEIEKYCRPRWVCESCGAGPCYFGGEWPHVCAQDGETKSEWVQLKPDDEYTTDEESQVGRLTQGDKCPKCKGTGRPMQNPHGYCPDCQGTGKKPSKKLCEDCYCGPIRKTNDGPGKPLRDCFICHNKSNWHPKENDKCSECAGLGLPPVFPGSERRRCNTCGSTGKKPSEQEKAEVMVSRETAPRTRGAPIGQGGPAPETPRAPKEPDRMTDDWRDCDEYEAENCECQGCFREALAKITALEQRLRMRDFTIDKMCNDNKKVHEIIDQNIRLRKILVRERFQSVYYKDANANLSDEELKQNIEKYLEKELKETEK